VRNIRPSFRWGLWGGIAYSAIDTYLLKGRAPGTLRHHADHTQLKKASECAPIVYPKPDGKISFDRLSSVFISATNHAEEQPCHLRLKDASAPSAPTWPSTTPRRPATARPACTKSSRTRAARAADQRPELPALQDLRHQGPDPEHRLGVPEGGGGPNYPNM
jgi:electron-transferring-flavoprotein dehydrogenase